MRLVTCVFCGLLCALPAAAPATAKKDDGFVRIKTALWSADVPATWGKGKKVVKPRRTRWLFTSPTRNYQLRINIAKDPGGDFRKLAEANLERMKKRNAGLKISSTGYGDALGRPFFQATMIGKMARKAQKHDFLTVRLFTRLQRKLLVTFSLSANVEYAADFEEIVKRVLGSIVLDSQPGAAKPAAAK